MEIEFGEAKEYCFAHELLKVLTPNWAVHIETRKRERFGRWNREFRRSGLRRPVSLLVGYG